MRYLGLMKKILLCIPVRGMYVRGPDNIRSNPHVIQYSNVLFLAVLLSVPLSPHSDPTFLGYSGFAL